MKISLCATEGRKALATAVVLVMLVLAFHIVDIDKPYETWDEITTFSVGLYQWYNVARLDFSPQSWHTYDAVGSIHPPLDRFAYGIVNGMYMYSRLGGSMFSMNYTQATQAIYEYKNLIPGRLLSALFTVGAALLLFGYARRRFGLRMAAISGAIFAMLPVILAQTKIAALDAMLLFMFTLSVYAFTRGLESRKWFIISLIVTGLTVATKFNAVTLFVLLPVIYFIHRRPKAIGKKHLLLIPFVSAAVLYLVWPRLWFDPIGGLLANFNWWQSLGDVSEYFLGGLSHPIYYMATYVVVTTPVLILATLALGVYYSARHRDGENLTLLAWLLIPLFVYSFYHFRQAGPRYVIMIYPAVAMLAGIGIHRISSWLSGMHRFNARKTAVYMAIPFIVFVYLLAVDVSVHPYYLDYYNELVGGPGNVYNNHMFAIGQWGEGIGEAAFWLNSNAKPNSTVQYFVQPRHAVPFPSRMRADLTDITPFIPKYISGTENINWDMTNVTPEADYLVENTFFRLYMNESFHADIAGSYELIKTIDVQGAPLAWVYTRK